MTIRFNEETEFPCSTVSEMHNSISSIPDLLVCNLPYTEELYNNIYSFLNTNTITKIEIINNVGQVIYTTVTLIVNQRINRSFSNDNVQIMIDFGMN